jgi:hypothetical protein
VPSGIPAPEIGCPTATPVVLETAEMLLPPEVTRPVGCATIAVEVLAVAGFDSVIVFGPLLVAATVVPAGMPAPVMTCPISPAAGFVMPLRLDTDVMTLLPETRTPVGATVLVAVAGDEIVIVSGFAEEELTAVTVEFAGMPEPVMACPTATPLMLDTPEITLLPLVMTPVGAMVLVALAPVVTPGAANVTVLVPTAVMYANAGMPVPVIGCPGKRPETLDTDVRMKLPLMATAVNVLFAALTTAVITAPAGTPTPETAFPTVIGFVAAGASV